MVSQTELETAIRDKVDNITALVVSDVSGGCGQAYDVIIVSPVFDGMNTLKRHRMVNDLLKEQIAQLHAFSQKTYTPQQYDALSGPTPKPSESVGATAGAAAGTAGGAGSAVSSRPSTLDTSVAQRGSKVHHRTTSSNVSVPELILTPDAGDSKLNGPSGRGHSRQRSLTPAQHQNDFSPAGISSPSGNTGVSRLHYNTITDVEFWNELHDLLERRFTQRGEDGSSSPSVSPTRPRGEAELLRVFEDFLQTQKQHMSGA